MTRNILSRSIRIFLVCLMLLGSRPARAELVDVAAAPRVKGGSPIVLQVATEGSSTTLTLSTDRPDVVVIEQEVLVLPGPAEVTLPTRAVSDPVVVTINFQSGEEDGYVQVTVDPPVLSAISFRSLKATAGSLLQGTITIDGPAPFSGLPLKVTVEPAGAAELPERVTVAPNEIRTGFSLLLKPESGGKTLRVDAELRGGSVETSLEVSSPSLVSLLLDEAATGGRAVEGEVTINVGAPPGGLSVSLKSSNPAAAQVESEVRIDPGARSARFQVLTSPVAASRSVTVSASLESTSASGILEISAPALAGVDLSPRGAIGGRAVRGRARLSGPAAVPTTVALASADQDLAVVPPAVVVPAGQSWAAFPVETGRVFESTEALITAAYAGESADGLLQLLPAAPGDWDGDGDTDLLDFAELQVCFTGPGGAEDFRPPSRRCAGTFDFDGDGDLDHQDFEAFQGLFRGPPEGLPDPTVTLDESVEPAVAEIPAADGSPRPVAALVDAAGNAADFVESELVILGDQDLDPLLARWGGKVLDSYDPADYGFHGPRRRLVRIRDERADTANLIDDLRILNPDRTGDLRISSEAGIRLLAAAARETRDGGRVALNWVPRSSGIREGACADGSFESGSVFDAFKQGYFGFKSPPGLKDLVAQTGVTAAWQLLELAKLLPEKVPMAIIDGGFDPNPDFPAGTVFLDGTGPDPRDPWHGTAVASIAVGTLDNGYGAAGVAGPVAGQVTTLNASDNYGIGRAILEAVNHGARIINISSHVAPSAVTTIFADMIEDQTIEARDRGVLIFAAAGNDNRDVDEQCCANLGPFEAGCWECAWFTPCENEGVICIGALGVLTNGPLRPTRTKASDSNYGLSQVHLFAPGTVWVGPDPIIKRLQMAAGTSMASPFVAGVAALVLAANSGLDPRQVEKILLQTAPFGGFDGVQGIVNAYGAVLRAIGDAPPSIKILEPRTGETVPKNFGGSTNVVFFAEATDPENEIRSIAWRSDRQGLLGFGKSISRTDLLPGTHLITASVLDAGRYLVTDQVTIQVVDMPPSLFIYEPRNGARFFAGQRVALRGESFDPRTGGRLPIIAVGWYASLGGTEVPIGTGHVLDHELTAAGPITLRFKRTDVAAAPSDPMVSIIVESPPVDVPPTATIDNPTGPLTFTVSICNTGPTVFLQGHGYDKEDGEGIRLEWHTDRSDVQDSFLGQGTQITATLLRKCNVDTVHHITLRAIDSAGNVTVSQERTITLWAPPR